jgi:alpha-D-ribose 1-methylphosphonate 5-triphosphate diphosphatase PhnM
VQFGLQDRGRLAAGLRVDLLLVDGDPVNDLAATLDLRRVWRGGVDFDLAPFVPSAVR